MRRIRDDTVLFGVLSPNSSRTAFVPRTRPEWKKELSTDELYREAPKSKVLERQKTFAGIPVFPVFSV